MRPQFGKNPLGKRSFRPGRPGTLLGSSLPETPLRRSQVTKSEFVDAVAAKSGLSKGDAATAVDAVLDSIEDALRRGEEVAFTGFGKFTVAERGARQGVNPQTGERIQIAASKAPKFSAGADFKKALKTPSY